MYKQQLREESAHTRTQLSVMWTDSTSGEEDEDVAW